MNGNSGTRVQEYGGSDLLPVYKHFLEGVYMTFHFGRNEKFSISCLVNLFISFHLYPKKKLIISMRSF